MAALPDAQYSIANLIDNSHEQRKEKPRPHMGCSLLGHPCDRYLWLNFRWAAQEAFPGRMLRLFRRGHLEEINVVRDLQAIGCHVTDTGDKQSRVDFGKHVSGSIDGIIQSGLPGGGSKPHILEIKTHSQKSFDKLKKEGVQKSKPMHWVQMHIYGWGKGLERALYFAVNKNTDEIYTERVHIDAGIAASAVERGQRIAMSERMPEPMPGASAMWHECKFCPAYDMCWQQEPTKHVNCRTCAHSTPQDDSTFKCEKWQAVIPAHAQYDGCKKHTLHPDVVPWKFDDTKSTEDCAAYLIDGRVVLNGDPGAGGFESKELLANAKGCSLADDRVSQLRAMGGRVVG